MTIRIIPLLVLLASSADWIAAQTPQKFWRVSDAPVLSIGARDAEGPELFGAVAGAVRLTSGVIVVGDRKSLELRFFSPAGKHLRTSGRGGAGPGEFRSMASVHRCAGDSVFVYDYSLFRMSVFSPDGEYVRSTAMRQWFPNGLPPYDFWCHPAGILAFVGRTADRPTHEGPLRHTVEISLVNRNSQPVSLGKLPASEMYFKPPAAGPRHLGKRTTVAIASTFVYVGTGDAYEVEQYSFQGDRIGRIHEARPRAAITPAQVSTYIGDFIASRPARIDTMGHRQFFHELEWPKEYPAYANLLVDGSDNLWIQEYPIPGTNRNDWVVFDRTGKKIATVSLPKDLRLLEAGADNILGAWRDEFDVDFVRLYSLVK